MADALGMCIGAEGMKTMEPWRELQALSCNQTQGASRVAFRSGERDGIACFETLSVPAIRAA